MDHADLGPAASSRRRTAALPLTSTPPGTPERRLLGALALAAAAALTLSACAGITGLGDRASRDQATATYETGASGKSHDRLPAWVPDDATAVRQSSRPGGDEQILTMRAAATDLPATCTAVSAENPLAPHPEDGSAASDYRTVSTLRADWWPVEVEQGATVMCGRWWITTGDDGLLYAFTPERRTVPVN
jgi:hypothetical protein